MTSAVVSSIARRTRLLHGWLALVALLCALVALSVVGVASLLFPPAPPPVPTVPDVVSKQAVVGFAEGCARSYLTWDSAHPERHARSLDGCVAGGDLASGLGLQVPDSGRQDVLYSTPIRVHEATSEDSLVTVQVGTTSGLKYLVLPVRRVRGGAVSLTGYPALVGAPRVGPATGSDDLESVEDQAVSATAARVMRNYLSRDRRNLSGDLASGADFSLPAQSLSLSSVDRVAWLARPSHVAVDLTAADGQGAIYRLRYELKLLEQGGRWLIQRIETPTVLIQGVTP